jgi:hypothetical protein
MYGCGLDVCEAVWFKFLQQQDVDAKDIRNGNGEQSANPVYLLLSLRFLWAYRMELELAGLFKMSEQESRPQV